MREKQRRAVWCVLNAAVLLSVPRFQLPALLPSVLCAAAPAAFLLWRSDSGAPGCVCVPTLLFWDAVLWFALRMGSPLPPAGLPPIPEGARLLVGVCAALSLLTVYLLREIWLCRVIWALMGLSLIAQLWHDWFPAALYLWAALVWIAACVVSEACSPRCAARNHVFEFLLFLLSAACCVLKSESLRLSFPQWRERIQALSDGLFAQWGFLLPLLAFALCAAAVRVPEDACPLAMLGGLFLSLQITAWNYFAHCWLIPAAYVLSGVWLTVRVVKREPVLSPRLPWPTLAGIQQAVLAAAAVLAHQGLWRVLAVSAPAAWLLLTRRKRDRFALVVVLCTAAETAAFLLSYRLCTASFLMLGVLCAGTVLAVLCAGDRKPWAECAVMAALCVLLLRGNGGGEPVVNAAFQGENVLLELDWSTLSAARFRWDGVGMAAREGPLLVDRMLLPVRGERLVVTVTDDRGVSAEYTYWTPDGFFGHIRPPLDRDGGTDGGPEAD